MPRDSRTSSSRLKIALTRRPPVLIHENEWPRIAYAWDKDWEDWAGRDSDNTIEIRIEVRQHRDGRALVYGTYKYSFAQYYEYKAGELLDAGASLPEAIDRVGKQLCEQMQTEHKEQNGLEHKIGELTNWAIEKLPAQDLSEPDFDTGEQIRSINSCRLEAGAPAQAADRLQRILQTPGASLQIEAAGCAVHIRHPSPGEFQVALKMEESGDQLAHCSDAGSALQQAVDLLARALGIKAGQEQDAPRAGRGGP